MKRSRFLTLLITGVLSLLLVTAGTSIALSGIGDLDSSEDGLTDDLEKHHGEFIGHEEALEIAFERANGTLIEFEFDREDAVYEMEIIGEEKEYEIEIDAKTGEVLEYEEEYSDDYDPEWDYLIGHEKAIEKAFERIDNGTLIEFELDDYIYEIEIKKGMHEYEFKIDAYSGEIIEGDGSSKPPHDGLIGHEEALSIAFEDIDWGVLIEFELDDHIYEIEIISEEREYEFEIDARTGEILEFEADESDDFNEDWYDLIGHEEAIEKALDMIENGTLVKFELDEDDDGYIYEIEIKRGMHEHEIYMESSTGEIIEYESDEPRKDRGVGRYWYGTEGRFVSFDLMEKGISNYTLKTNQTNLTLFENIVIQDLMIEDTETQGAKYEIEGDDTEIRIYDVAPALMKIDAESDYDEDIDPEWDELIGHEEALDIAFDLANGTLVEFELEEDDYRYFYEIEIVEYGMEYEIEIDAYTGEVMDVDEDESDDYDPEWDELIGHEEAIDTAFGLANGTLVEFELEENGEGYIYEIEISEEEKKYEIEIEATTGDLIKFESDDRDEPRSISFELGELEILEQDGPNLVLGHENYTAKLLSVSPGEDGWNSSLDIEINDGVVNYTFTEDIFLVFRMTDHDVEGLERELDMNISNGIYRGKVGGEVRVDRDYDISLSYTDMQIMAQIRDQNRIRVTVSSDTLGGEGKIVAIRIYKEVLDADTLDELEVTFDGEEIIMADHYNDLIDPSEEAKYLVTIGLEKIEVLVMVPHFSTHIIEIARRGELESILDIQYYLPFVLITGAIVGATVWIAKKGN